MLPLPEEVRSQYPGETLKRFERRANSVCVVFTAKERHVWKLVKAKWGRTQVEALDVEPDSPLSVRRPKPEDVAANGATKSKPAKAPANGPAST